MRRIYVVLDIDGDDENNAVHVVDALLDVGALQDAISEYAADDDCAIIVRGAAVCCSAAEAEAMPPPDPVDDIDEDDDGELRDDVS